MEKFAGFILKHKKWVLGITAALVVLAVVATVLIVFLGKINSDMLTYLPDEMQTMKGQAFLSEHFGIEGDAMLVVQSDGDYGKDSAIYKAVEDIQKLKITKIDGDKEVTVSAISQFIWVGEATKYDGFPEIGGVNVGELIDAKELIAYLMQQAPESEWDSATTPKYNYIFLGMLNTSASSQEAFQTLNAMRDAFTSRGLVVASEGMTHTSDLVMNGMLGELPLYLIFGLMVVLFILFLSTDSFLDPLVLLITLGVSLILAMGTNIFFPSISIISFAVSSILQLAVTMDYAIFFMHIYKQKKKEIGTAEGAVKKALPNAWGSILSSALTTVGGFAALFFMRFQLGADMGMVLIKAVVLSLLSVIILQPVLTIIMNKGIEKTQHKAIALSFEKTSKGVMKVGKVLAMVTLLLLLPAFVFQNLVDYSYFKMYNPPENPQSYQVIATELRNQLVIAVPYYVKNEAAEEGKTQVDFIADLKNDPKVKNVISIFSVMKPDKLTPQIIALMSFDPLGKSYFSKVKEGDSTTLYTLYTVLLTGDVEDKSSLETFDHIMQTVERYFGETYYPMGMLTGIYDMASVTPLDFTLVSLVSALIIFFVLMLILRQFRQAILLILTIEIAIFLNLAISVLIGAELNFMVYILISSVQLGCTVDYAILLATRYKDAYFETGGNRYEAARLAFKNSASAILISASIIISLCASVLLISKNIIIQQMMELIARGGAISLLLVLTSLPTFLSCTRPTLSKKEKAKYPELAAQSFLARLKQKNSAKKEIESQKTEN